jgi:hypothetical protein
MIRLANIHNLTKLTKLTKFGKNDFKNLYIFNRAVNFRFPFPKVGSF